MDNNLKKMLQEDIVNASTVQTEESALKQVVPKITPQQWNKLFFQDMKTFSPDDFQLLGQLSTYLSNKYNEYQKNPKAYNQNIK